LSRQLKLSSHHQAPFEKAIDANGVDLFSGRMMFEAPGVSIGGSDQGLTFVRAYRDNTWANNLVPQIDTTNGSYPFIVSLGLNADSFTHNGTAFVNTEGNGATLVMGTQFYTYTASDGTRIDFDKNLKNGAPTPIGLLAQVSSLVRPDGMRFTYTYGTTSYCSGIKPPGGQCSVPETVIHRLKSVDSNFGYRVTFSYASVSPGPLGGTLAKYWRLTKAEVTNLAGATGTPLASNSYPVTGTDMSVTDAMGRVTQYVMSGADLTGIKLPGSATNDVTVGYTSGRVTSIATAAGTTSYASSDASGVRTVTVTDPLSHATTYKFDIASKRMTEVTDANSHTTAMQYDTLGRTTRVTQPEGNYVQVTYDTRGNVTEQRQVAKSGSGLADVVTSATYPATCTNPVTCNKPTTTTDARGNVTDYTYSTTHGGVLGIGRWGHSIDGCFPVPDDVELHRRCRRDEDDRWLRSSDDRCRQQLAGGLYQHRVRQRHPDGDDRLSLRRDRKPDERRWPAFRHRRCNSQHLQRRPRIRWDNRPRPRRRWRA